MSAVQSVRLCVCVPLFAVTTTAVWACDVPVTPSEFWTRIGVNAHVEYTDGRYANVDNVLSDLQFMHIANVRDGNLNPRNQGQAAYGALARQGIRFDLIVDGNVNPYASLDRATSLARMYPDAVAAIEGPNEIDNFPISFMGQSGSRAAALLTETLHIPLAASAYLQHARFYSPSLSSRLEISGSFDAWSIHPYPQHGQQPGAWLANEARLAPAGANIAITEAGYASLPGSQIGVDERTQAKLILNMLFDAARMGVCATYVYELLDAYPDPDHAKPELHFGLFRYENAPKPAASALHNLGELFDTHEPSGGGRSARIAVSGLPSSGFAIQLATATTSILAVWNEPPVWDANTGTARTAPTIPIVLNTDYSKVRIFDPLDGSLSVRENQRGSIPIDLPDHPLVLEMN
jgi:hypothetical protein